MVLLSAAIVSSGMPPLALLKPVQWSPGLRLGMLALRGYLVLSAVLLLVKAIRLSGS